RGHRVADDTAERPAFLHAVLSVQHADLFERPEGERTLHMAMTFSSEAWYVMVLYTLLALYGETGMSPTVETDAHMIHMAREQGKGADDLRLYLQSGASQPSLTFASEAWYVMVVHTLFGLYSETGLPPTVETGAHM